jgi:hypothetical protein
MMPGEIVTLGEIPPPRPPLDWAKSRIIAVIAEGVPRMRLSEREPLRWHRPPGLLPWSEARVRLGGRRGPLFVEAVTDLLGEGLVIEVWLIQKDQREAPHLLVLPGKFKHLPREAARVRGRPDVLKKEPWARQLR